MKLVQLFQIIVEDFEDGENDEYFECEDENLYELSDVFERELCEFWDMFMNMVRD